MWSHLKFAYDMPNWTKWSHTKACIAKLSCADKRENSMTKVN